MLKLVRDMSTVVDLEKVEVLEKETGIYFKEDFRHQDNFNTVDIEIDGSGIVKPVDYNKAKRYFDRYNDEYRNNYIYGEHKRKQVKSNIYNFCRKRNKSRKGNFISLIRDIKNFLIENYCKLENCPYGDTPIELYIKKRGEKKVWAGHEWYCQIHYGFKPNPYFIKKKAKRNRMANIFTTKSCHSNTISDKNRNFYKFIDEITDDRDYGVGYKYNPTQGFKLHIWHRDEVVYCKWKSPMALKHDKHKNRVCLWAW